MTEVTDEMIAAGDTALGDPVIIGAKALARVYLAMRALDPELIEHTKVVACFDKALADKSDDWFRLKRELAALQPVVDAAVAWDRNDDDHEAMGFEDNLRAAIARMEGRP